MSDPLPRPEPCVPQLLEAMRAVGSGLGPHATLERICATATALVDAGRVAIEVLAEDGIGFADFVHHGVDEETVGWVEPIRVHGEVFGNLYLGDKRGGGPFTEHDLTLVRVLATEAGIAIGNARLYEAARQRERWIDGSVAVTTALLSGGDIGDSFGSSPNRPAGSPGRRPGSCCCPRRRAAWRSSPWMRDAPPTRSA